MAESKVLRGLAILGIMLHNYCHFLPMAVKENEYTFNPDKPRMFLDRLMALDHDLFVHFMSFLGHYGVPVFLFISGFGLVRKYEQGASATMRPLSFIGSHYLKLLRLMFLGYVAFAVVSYLHPRGYHGYTVERVVAQMLMYINLLPNPNHIIKPGPYWFFGLMLQLYAVYALLMHRRGPWVTISLIGVCWLAQAMLPPSSDPGGEILNRVRYNFVGGMLPFGVGVLYARHGVCLTKAAYAAVVVVSAAAVLLGGLYFQTWLWVPLFVVTGAVASVKLVPSSLYGPLVWVGALSSSLFVMHPIAREIIIRMSYRGYVYSGIAVYVASSVLLALLFRWLHGYMTGGKRHTDKQQA